MSDETALLTQVEEVLNHWGLDTTTVTTRETAALALTRQNFDLLMLDADLPGDLSPLLEAASELKIVSLVGPGEAPVYHRKFGVQLLAKPVSHSELWNVLLPRSEAAGSLPEEGQRGVPPLRVLLVEDNVVNQQLALMMLKGYGHEVKVAANGEEALAMFETFPFDLILMDVQMPVMDGLEASRQIRALEASAGGDATPILALTAHALKGDRERCLQAGRDGYLTKPLSEAQLWSTVATVLSPSLLDERWSEADKRGGTSLSLGGGVLPRFGRAAMLARVSGNEENLRKLLTLYLDNAPGQAAKLKAALEKGDTADAAREAHTLKGMLLTIAAEHAAQLALSLEELLLRSASQAECRGALSDLERELVALADELRYEVGAPV